MKLHQCIALALVILCPSPFSCTTWKVFDLAKSLVKTLPEMESQSCLALIQDTIFNPMKCWEDFLKPTEEVPAKGAEDEDGEAAEHGDAAASETALATVKAKYNRATGCLLDLLVALMSGQYGDDLREISQCGEPVAKMLQPTARDAGEEASEGASIALVVQLCEVVKAFDSSSKSVSVKSTAPAPSLMSTLNQTQPVEELTAERERVWKLVQGERRKFATFSVPKSFKQESLLGSFRACGKAYGHSGTSQLQP